MKIDADTLERMAKAGYQTALENAPYQFVHAIHDWEKQPEQLRREWRLVVRAMLVELELAEV